MHQSVPQSLVRRRLRLSTVLLLAGAALVTGVATAQEGTEQPAPTQPTATQPAAQQPTAAQPSAVVAADVEAKDELTLSAEQMASRGAAAVAAIDAAQSTVAGMVTSAKDNRDVVKVLCLDDKNNQVGVALRTAEDREASLRAAIDAGAEERARHEFTLLMVLKERVDVLLSEANQCIGEETGFTGEAELIVEVDPNLPEVEPETVIIAPATVIEPAEISSPS